nr:oligosaccharide flippase family protein [Bacteroidales bacterium]
MMSLKEKTISGLLWSTIDSFANQGIQFIVGIILARLLSPREFGLLGMISIFIAISQTFINSGFSSALIRKKD